MTNVDSFRSFRVGVLYAACLAGAMALGVGCDTVKAPPAGKVDQLSSRDYPHNVAVEGLHEGLVFGDAIVDPSTQSRPMHVTQKVRNTADYPINVQYRFEFLDSRGRPLKVNMGWAFVNMPSRVEVSLDGAAIDTNAADWHLTLRPAR